METLASLKPKGGEPGQLIEQVLENAPSDLGDQVDTFRMDLARGSTSNYIWPWLLVTAGCVFFGDVFVRRVAIRFGWLATLLTALRVQKTTEETDDQRLDQLRRRKETVKRQIDERRDAVRFEPASEEDHSDTSVEPPGGLDRPAATRPPAPEQGLAAEPEPEDYAERLLKAKKRLWKQRDNE